MIRITYTIMGIYILTIVRIYGYIDKEKTTNVVKKKDAYIS